MEPNIPNLPYILTTPFSEPLKLVKKDAPIDPRLNRLRNTYIPWQNVTDAKNHLVLQRQKCHDPPKPVEMKKSKGKGGKGSSSRNPEPDPLVEANQAFIQSQNNFAAAIKSFIPGPNLPLMVWNSCDVDNLVLLYGPPRSSWRKQRTSWSHMGSRWKSQKTNNRRGSAAKKDSEVVTS
ncbi:unnamed protein product [Prunus armeniaca]|uniref:Uncharacterized protein n=1 Tax=Prunus armeniaca TaxID=36596 RepID=A0A6J5UVY5_PRUAR|nr:unnamed protein product [Prunus armeniaca]